MCLLKLSGHHHVKTYLWHLLGNNVDHVSWCDVLLAFGTRIMFLPSTALLFPLFLLFLFLFGSLFLPPLLLQFHILVRHGQTCVWLNTKHLNVIFSITAKILKKIQEENRNQQESTGRVNKRCLSPGTLRGTVRSI